MSKALPVLFAGMLVVVASLAVRGNDALQREAAKERTAKGPWKQVAIIESHEVPGFGGSSDGKTPSRLGNLNALIFLGADRFAIADGANPIRVFDADSGTLLQSFGTPGKDSWIRPQLIASSDGRYVVRVPDVSPQVWDTRTGKLVATLPAFDDKYTEATFLPGDRSLATYRGERARGQVDGNLQIWDLDEAAGAATLRQSLNADTDARGLATAGPYLVVKNSRRAQVFDAKTLRVLLQQRVDTNEEFLFVAPPQGSSPGHFASIELAASTSGDWRKHVPQFRLLSLADGREIKRWRCPIVEDDQNDHRFQARYATSPKRGVIAIAQAGRVNFFRFENAAPLGTFPTTDKYVAPSVTFLNEAHALVAAGSLGGDVRVVDVATGRELAVIPDSDFYPTVSPDGRHILLRRNEVPLAKPDEKPRSWVRLQKALVALWIQYE